MPPSPDNTGLRIRHMRVIWRDTFVVENSASDFLAASRERLVRLPCYVSDSSVVPASDQPEFLRVVERVSRSVAVIGHSSLLRFQFASFVMANLQPVLARLRRPPHALTVEQIRERAAQADEREHWIYITPMLLLHRAGVGVMQYHATFVAWGDGYPPDKAIELVRMGISAQLLKLPDVWREALPAALVDRTEAGVQTLAPDYHLVVAGLRDLSQDVIAAGLVAPLRQGRRAAPEAAPPRPTGSTTVVLVESNPPPTEDLAAFVAQHALPLRGVGALDTYYRERAAWIVERELTDNLSSDQEAVVHLLGNSELIVYHSDTASILPGTRSRLHLSSDDLAVTYLYMHYVVLLEWIYIQQAILLTYLHRLDDLAGSPVPRRPEMIGTLQGALGDLIQYQEDITPYATRVEFLERARRYHKLDQLAERFERKQELLLNYASEYHDYREARATQFLNWLAGILTGAALADLILTLTGITPQQTTLYLGITLGSIALVLGILAALLRR